MNDVNTRLLADYRVQDEEDNVSPLPTSRSLSPSNEQSKERGGWRSLCSLASSHLRSFFKGTTATVTMTLVSLLFFAGLMVSYVSGNLVPDDSSCVTIREGYQCLPKKSHHWGMYSPYFSLEDESKISPAVPPECRITFVQVLSRHGARYPTSSKSKAYADLIRNIQQNATAYMGDYGFLKDYEYELGADDLTSFGVSEMTDSGIKFYDRYRSLARNVVPFIRASGSYRVIASGEAFIKGFQSAKAMDPYSDKSGGAPVVSVVIEEGNSFNNTLDAGSCPVFENDSSTGDDAQSAFANTFAPAIMEKIEKNLPGVTLTMSGAESFMDMCPFDTVGGNSTRSANSLSPFCNLFTQEEWRAYDYYQSIGKYYGYAGGSPLGPAQGIGYVNELIARLTHTAVEDQTSVNQTLDSNALTFPLNATLYADFSHDSSMTSIFAALGLFNGTSDLSMTKIESIEETDGYSAAWTVPFAARAYIEMMECDDSQQPLVRILLNDRVWSLHGCEADSLGRCTRDDFVQGLSFARSGGNWASCFA